MDDAMNEYLESLGATSPVVSGVELALNWYAKLGAEWRDAFVCETVDDAGVRTWGSLWLFNKTYVMEIRDFVTQQDYDIAVNDAIIHLRCQTKDFDWSEASLDSRAYVHFSIATGISGELRASGKNCERLAAVVKNYLMPSIASSV